MFLRQRQLLLPLDGAIGRQQRERRGFRIGVKGYAQRECVADVVDRGNAHPASVQQVAQLVIEPCGFGGRARGCHFDPQRFGAVEYLTRGRWRRRRWRRRGLEPPREQRCREHREHDEPDYAPPVHARRLPREHRPRKLCDFSPEAFTP